jgi:hypothetical protein
MLTKHLLKGQIRFRVKIFCHNEAFLVILCKDTNFFLYLQEKRCFFRFAKEYTSVMPMLGKVIHAQISLKGG